MSPSRFIESPPPRNPILGHNQNPRLVLDGSPLAMVGMFVEVLRERYSPGNGPERYPWDADVNKTKIVIAASFEEEGNTPREKQPAIWVDKDESSYSKIMIGDRVGHEQRTGKDYQSCLATVPLTITCIAGRRSESAFIGDVTQWSLHASSDVIQATFALHDMTPPTLSRTMPYDSKPNSWATTISFQVQYNVSWTYVPIAPLLQNIALRVQASGETPSDYFLERVLGMSDIPPLE